MEYMRYFSLHNGDHKLVGIGTGIGGNEITKEEYDEIFDEIRQKENLVKQLFDGEITAEDVTPEWMEEIQQRADELKNWSEGDETENPDEATEADYQNALREMGVEVWQRKNWLPPLRMQKRKQKSLCRRYTTLWIKVSERKS